MKVNIGVKINEDMKHKIRYIAEKKAISYADAVRVALYQFIDEYEKKHHLIDETLIHQEKIRGV